MADPTNGDTPPLVAVVTPPAAATAQDAPAIAQQQSSMVSQQSSSSSMLGGGTRTVRKRSAAVRATSKAVADAEPLLVKANREEHFMAVRAPGIQIAVANLQGWRKANEDAHAVIAQHAFDVQCETRTPAGATTSQSQQGSPVPSALSSPAPTPGVTPLASAHSSPSPSTGASTMGSREGSPKSSTTTEYGAIRDTPVVAFLGIFDGHNGSAAAKFVASHLAGIVANKLQNLAPKGGDEEGAEASQEEEHAAIEASFQQCDDDLREASASGGSTAACAIITSSHVHMCTVGDCRMAALDMDGSIIAELSRDHTMSASPEEKERIAALGVSTENDRVDGKLAVTRAFGDFAFKPADKPVAEHPVLCKPSIVTLPRADVRDVVAGCDGVWELNKLDVVAKNIAEGLIIDEGVSRWAHVSCATNRPLVPNTMALMPGSDNITVGAVRIFEMPIHAVGGIQLAPPAMGRSPQPDAADDGAHED